MKNLCIFNIVLSDHCTDELFKANKRPPCVSVQFFEKAAGNVKENIGEEVQTDQLIKEACRNCLEYVRPVFF